MKMTKREALQKLLWMCDEMAEIVRKIDDERLNAYVLAEFEGASRGWLGEFTRDKIEKALEACDEEDEEIEVEIEGEEYDDEDYDDEEYDEEEI